MNQSANVRAIQTFDDLKGALARFGAEACQALAAADLGIRQTLDWLQERLNHWQNEVQQRQEEVRRAEAALARCRASGYRDRDGHYHAPDCSAYERAVFQARARLREAETELANVRRWLAQVQQAVREYEIQARRLQELATTHTDRARAFLGRAQNRLEQYLAVAPVAAPSAVAASPEQPGLSPAVSTLGITWAEKKAILARLDAGQQITPEDWQRLQQPISDLQTSTLAQDEVWVRQLLESPRYAEIMRDS
jgi:chromosome segregation ATPase